MIITIDGPSGSGKSTLAKRLAKSLKFDYLDTGAHYRAITYWIVFKNGDLSNFDFSILEKLGEKRYIVSGEDVTEIIRTPEIAKNVSDISKRKEVRDLLTSWQRAYAKNRDVILDGRDAGSVVFPYAECKFFLVASSEVRAKRRHLELIKKKMIDPKLVSWKTIEQELIERDIIDSSREIAPLIKPLGAIEIDSSLYNIKQVEKLMWYELKKRHVYPYHRWKALLFGEGFARSSLGYLMGKSFINIVLKLFFRLEFKGQENIIRGKAIIAPNHVSFLDPPLVAAAFSEGIFYLAQEYLFRVPIFRHIIKHLNALPVRGDVGDKSSFQSAIMALEGGNKVMIFPEGERSYTGKLLHFKRGVALLSQMTSSPLIPVYIHGAYEAWKRGSFFFKPFRRIVVVIGKPIYPESFSHIEGKKDQQREMLSELKHQISMIAALYNAK
ncbi:MAG: (d)CMP kinase [Chlamydiae bacterium]|nr:(d)CMP kinase [Chlamydiota bacterium]